MQGEYDWQVDVGEPSGTVLEESGGDSWVSGNETFQSRASIGRARGGRLSCRSFRDAEHMDTHEKVAMQASTTRLSFPLSMAYTCVSTLLDVGKEVA